MAKFTPVDLNSGFSSTTALNLNFDSLETLSDTWLSLDGTSPNSMSATLDLAGNDIINIDTVSAQNLALNGDLVVPEDLAITTLPDQVGQIGKFLSTNGISASWQETITPDEGILVFDTVADLKAESLITGLLVETKGYYTAGDSGDSTYLIEASQSVDGLGDHTLVNGNVALVKDVKNILQYGAISDAATDIQPAIDAMKTALGFAHVPTNSTFSIEEMVQIEANEIITIGANTVVKRYTANSASTDPVFWLRGQRSTLTGEGASSQILTENRCPSGVVLVGHEDMTTSHSNVNNCTIQDLWIAGSTQFGQTTGDPDASFVIRNPQFSSLTSYFHNLSNLSLVNANFGLWLHGWANGNRISDIHMQRIGNTTLANGNFMLYINGALDNAITNIFYHGSTDSTAIRIEDFDNTGNGGFDHVSNSNSLSNQIAEQGGSTEKFLVTTGSGGVANYIQGVANTSQFGTVSDQFKEDNTILTNVLNKFKDIKEQGDLADITLVSDVITIVDLTHTIVSESGVSDDLVTINGGNTGELITIQGKSGDVITVKDGTGNILCHGSADIVLSPGSDKLQLIFDGTNWSTSPLWDVS